MEKLLIGKVIDNYRILSVQGRGGMGIVYKAEDITLEKIVALKIIDPALAREESFLRRFRTEAKALAKLENPNIVTVHALRETEIGTCLIMEFIEGQTLSEWLDQNESMDYAEALPIFKQILNALEHTHGVGVIHRDIKPANIILTEKGNIKVTDFGLARIQHGSESTITQGLGGTLKYISPEQATNIGNVDHRTDIYSVGMTFYEVLAGRTPFGKRDSDYSILKCIVEKKFPAPSQFNPDIPSGVTKIVMKAINKDPNKRYKSANDMLHAIRKFEKARKIQTLKKGESHTTPQEQTFLAKARQYRQSILIGFALLGALVVMIMAFSGSDTTSVSISTVPAGAAIILNNDLIGETPLHEHHIEHGTVSLRIQKLHYFKVDTTIVIREGQNQALSFVLESSATVAISVQPPDAEVTLDGWKLDSSQLDDLELPAGKHYIEIAAAGYLPFEAQFSLEQGQNPPLNYKLKAASRAVAGADNIAKTKPERKAVNRQPAKKPDLKYGKLQITSTPPGASVWVDGRLRGYSPIAPFKEGVGKHSIMIKKCGYQANTNAIEVRFQKDPTYIHARLVEIVIKLPRSLLGFLSNAEILYCQEKFTKAINNISYYLKICRDKKKTSDIKALILLPQIYLAKNDKIKARNAMKLLLRRNPNFDPNQGTLRNDFVALCKRVKMEMSVAK